MSDGDPFARRGSRNPDERGNNQPWNDEGTYEDAYKAPPVSPSRQPRDAQQERAGNQQALPQYPYRNNGEQSTARGTAQPRSVRPEQPTEWPDRPYANAPQQRGSAQPEYYGQDQAGDAPVDEWAEIPTDKRSRAPRAPRAPRQPIARPTMPPAIAAMFSIQDSRLLLVIAGSFVSLIAMSIVTFMRVDAMTGWFPIHIDASGEITRWASESSLWRLPFTIAMLTLMNVLSAFLLAMRERNIAWILIGSLPLIHLVGWIGLILNGW